MQMMQEGIGAKGMEEKKNTRDLIEILAESLEPEPEG
jgi:hypothetical protein